MARFKNWLSAFRLRTLPLSLSGIIVASSLAQYNGVFKWTIFILAILVTLSYQILSNLANDYGDGVKGTDNNSRIGPERGLQSGLITPGEMLNAIRINIFVAIVLTLSLIYFSFGAEHSLLAILFLGLGIIAVISALKYTMGESAYGYRGLGDIFVFVFFGLVSVIGCYMLFAKRMDFIVFLPATTIGLLSVGVLNLNNMRDIVSDATSNKITLAVKLGVKRAKIYHIVLIILAIIASFTYGILYYNSLLNFIFLVAYIPLIIHVKKVITITRPKDYDPELKKLALSTFGLAVLMAIGHLL